jgi:hypothetical protein
MFRTALIVSGIITLFTGLARAETVKAPRPLACSDFRVHGTGKEQIGVCYDGKRPSVWSTWGFVDITDPDGAKRRIAVGFR